MAGFAVNFAVYRRVALCRWVVGQAVECFGGEWWWEREENSVFGIDILPVFGSGNGIGCLLL